MALMKKYIKNFKEYMEKDKNIQISFDTNSILPNDDDDEEDNNEEKNYDKKEED